MARSVPCGGGRPLYPPLHPRCGWPTLGTLGGSPRDDLKAATKGGDAIRNGDSSTVFPLMFGFSDLVQGQGFIAQVRTEGRALMTFEDGEWWMSGVNPGGVMASGATEKEALAEFRQSYAAVLQDSASLADSFASFRSDVEAIFNSTTDEFVSQWTTAALAIRAGGDAGPFGDLERKPCDSVAFSVSIRELVAEKSRPQSDLQDRFCLPLPAAA